MTKGVLSYGRHILCVAFITAGACTMEVHMFVFVVLWGERYTADTHENKHLPHISVVLVLTKTVDPFLPHPCPPTPTAKAPPPSTGNLWCWNSVYLDTYPGILRAHTVLYTRLNIS